LPHRTRPRIAQYKLDIPPTPARSPSSSAAAWAAWLYDNKSVVAYAAGASAWS
jgi:hypothetical protein